MAVSPEEMCRRIGEVAEQAPTVSGSQLGTMIKVEFPSVALREQFGGLKQFIERHCEGKVVWISKHGGYDIYAHVTQLGSDGPAAAVARSDIWHAFTNPNSPYELVVDPAARRVDAILAGSTTPEAYVRVPKLTTEDYRRIAETSCMRLTTACGPRSRRLSMLSTFGVPGLLR